MHGEGLGGYAYGMWPVVVFSVLLFLFFVVGFIRPKRRFEWGSMGVLAGFIVALFAEMYGFPLTIYLLSIWLGKSYPVLNPFSHANGHLLLVLLGSSDSSVSMTVLHLISIATILSGLYVTYRGWTLIHAAQRDHKLVTDGVYSRVRHPQYAGLFLVTIGFLIQWPSLTTLIMWPILTFAYYRLSKREERDMIKQFGQEYMDYAQRVPAFVPKFKPAGAAR